LTEYGNIASAVVLDALGRLFDEDTSFPGATGVIAGFGPGITAEMAVGTWIVDEQRNADRIRRDASASYLELDVA
jgi:1,3,6,8-tetrahydroxynaphthalene synthase